MPTVKLTPAEAAALERRPGVVVRPAATVPRARGRARRPAVQREAAFQEAVIRYAQLQGWRVAWFRKVRVQRKGGATYWETPVGAQGAGWPDLVMARSRKMIAAELKIPPNKPTADQLEWIRLFFAAGIPAFVWTPKDWEKIEKVLRK